MAKSWGNSRMGKAIKKAVGAVEPSGRKAQKGNKGQGKKKK